jgi:ATP-binding cassette subfamily C (CFTR/MRP) protein 1
MCTLLPPLPQSYIGILVNAIPSVVPVVTFGAYVLLTHSSLSPGQAFTALSLFNVLRFPLFQLPMIITQVRHLCLHELHSTDVS